MQKSLIYVLVIALAVVFMIPLVWTVSTALKTRQQVYATPPKWVPTTFHVEEQGRWQEVSVISRIDGPAAQVRLLSGPRSGQVIPVSCSSLEGEAGELKVRLKAPEPFSAEILKNFPDGLAQVRLVESGADRYVSPADLREKTDPQTENFAKAWRALPLPFEVFVLNTYTITIINIIGQTLSCSLVAYGWCLFGVLTGRVDSYVEVATSVVAFLLVGRWLEAHGTRRASSAHCSSVCRPPRRSRGPPASRSSACITSRVT